MISLKKRTQGFTIVELLIVIVVIGILALLVITTYSGIQAKARDSKRQSDVGALQTQLEAYYSNFSAYPTMAHLNTEAWVTANMPSLDKNALAEPKKRCIVTSTEVADGGLATTSTAQHTACAARPAGWTDVAGGTTASNNRTATLQKATQP